MGCSSSTPAVVLPEAPTVGVPKEQYVVYEEKDGPFTVTDGTAEVPTYFAPKGIASKEGTPLQTLPNMFQEACTKKGDKIALRVERPAPAVVDGKAPPALPADQWTTWTYKQYYDDCSKFAKAMISVGHKPHQAVNVYGFNSPEWFIAHMGSVLGGGKAAGIYPSDTPEQVCFKAKHSGSAVACVENDKCITPFITFKDELPDLKAIVCWAYQPTEDKIVRSDGTEIKLYKWSDFLELGKDVETKELDKRIENQKPGHCCTLIYTSGTTGNPKAVMISHDNLNFMSAVTMETAPLCKSATAERVISYLPLSHVAGMLMDIITPVVSAAKSPSWVEVSFARPYDLKIGSIGDRLRAVEPTMFLGVPRVWEKIAEKMKAVGASITGLKKKVATWAKAKGLEYARNCQLGGTGAFPGSYARADKMVLSKVKANLGLSQCKYGMTGAAPITTDTLEYFGQLGIQINEVYGMSECAGCTTTSTDEAHVWGSCGWEVPGCEVKVFKIDPEDLNKKTECKQCDDIFNCPEEQQGEICFRGRHIMMGYMANPDLGEDHVKEMQKKNDDAIDKEGWLHSGDKGCVGKNGMVKITGRYKELIIGAGGENIAPVPVEDCAKSLGPCISNIIMIGDKRKFNVCLLTLAAEGATGEFPGNDTLIGAAAKVDPEVKTISAACKNEKFTKYLTDILVKVNKKSPNNAHCIQKFSILPADFSVETEELTPTLKLKRGVVEKKHAAFIDSMYEAKGTYVPYVQM